MLKFRSSLRFLEKETSINMNPRELFDKLLPETSVPGRLYFPTKNLDDLPLEDGSNEVEFVVRPLGNEWRAWTLCCSKRNARYPKPAITSASWSRVVEDDHLQVGDRLKFYIDNEEEGHFPRYWITVERLGTKLFGNFFPNPEGSYWQRIV